MALVNAAHSVALFNALSSALSSVTGSGALYSTKRALEQKTTQHLPESSLSPHSVDSPASSVEGTPMSPVRDFAVAAEPKTDVAAVRTAHF